MGSARVSFIDQDIPDIKMQILSFPPSFAEPPEPTRHKREIPANPANPLGSDGAEKNLKTEKDSDRVMSQSQWENQAEKVGRTLAENFVG